MSNFLFVIDGAFGFAKPALRECINRMVGHQISATMIEKLSHRPDTLCRIDTEMSPDVISITSERSREISSAQRNEHLWYNFGEQRYYINKIKIVKAIAANKYSFLVVRNASTILEIKKIYKNLAHVVPVYILTEEMDTNRYLEAKGISQEDSSFYIDRHREGQAEFKRAVNTHINLYTIISFDCYNNDANGSGTPQEHAIMALSSTIRNLCESVEREYHGNATIPFRDLYYWVRYWLLGLNIPKDLDGSD